MENKEDNILEMAIENAMNEDMISEMPREEIKFASFKAEQDNINNGSSINFTSISNSLENEINKRNSEINYDNSYNAISDMPLINSEFDYGDNQNTLSEESSISFNNSLPMDLNIDNTDFGNMTSMNEIDYNQNKIDNAYETISYSNNVDIVNNKKETKGKRYFGYNERLLVYVFSIIVLIIVSVVLFKNSIILNSKSDITYKQTSNLDYKVALKPNDYYKEQYLNKGMQYIASLIDYINVDFNYDFKASDKMNYKYIYYINADVKVTDSNDENKIIYSRSEKITDEKIVNMENSDEFSIKENLKVNYATYNDLVKGFKSSYAINADSNLVLSLIIDIVDEKGNKIKSKDSSDKITVKIPLTEQMINIKLDYKNINNSDNVKVYREVNISNKILFTLSIIFIILSALAIVLLSRFLNKTSRKKTAYELMLNKILREYDRVIITSRKRVKETGTIVDVKSFEELLDARDNLEKPIIYNEIHKGQKAVFIVNSDNESYRYVLKQADLEKGE